ncbi:MAG: alanine racemase [Alphaproteobacteria bacterium]
MRVDTAARGILSINLDALADNYRLLAKKAAGSEVAGVVKANGYGLGAREVAACLRSAGCRSFFVAHAHEGISLRESLEDARIFVLHGLGGGTGKDIADAGLIPVLNHPEELRRYATLALSRDQRLPAALQLDTGMLRLGFSLREVAEFDRRDLEAIKPVLVMSHLVSAEEPDNPLNQQQLERFAQRPEGLDDLPASLANSSGIFLGEAFHLDLCRPGVALYGVNPTPDHPNPMQPVVTLSAPVLQVHEVEKAATVGYNAAYEVPAGGRIATVPVGYADGYLRSASGRAEARIAGEIVPVAGRVSMDLITLDISKLPPNAVRPGCMADLVFGPDGVDRLAKAAGTIGYEVLTRLGTRLARRYTRSGP